MNHEKIEEILNLHNLWIIGDPKGQRADLRYANFRGANLRGANLRGADLRGANLRGANLRGADLRYANLRGADLRGANLRGADLRGADLRGADLRYANLRGADLRYVDLGFFFYRNLNEVIGLLPLILSSLKKYSFEAVSRRLAGQFYQPDERAILLPVEDFSGAFCIVPSRQEIWWWSYKCPDSETVTVLYRW